MAFAGKRNEQERKRLEKTDVKISERGLFNVDATKQDVLDDIETILPRLFPNRPEIARFSVDARSHHVAPFRIHEHDCENVLSTWPKTDPAMDRWFPDAVEQAPYIEDPHFWLDQRAANHV
ncbi:hypothetical protein J4E90_007468 [Alternaria incomplexa]|uniref:uncharacterized protein n=1 Tax=Alternaria incomplexa TaxID=1187928 RepID=UPI00221EE58F|nr:uncharacterized protein J4E90_007468 [Alternaria incomplexa]KAI4910038.1 hypothetical protein J4E90_007468 [Alternaria incomplexa]